MAESSSNSRSWRITALLFLAVAALAPAIMVGWVDAKQNQAPAPEAPQAPDWYRAGQPRAPWEGTPRPAKPTTPDQPARPTDANSSRGANSARGASDAPPAAAGDGN